MCLVLQDMPTPACRSHSNLGASSSVPLPLILALISGRISMLLPVTFTLMSPRWQHEVSRGRMLTQIKVPSLQVEACPSVNSSGASALSEVHFTTTLGQKWSCMEPQVAGQNSWAVSSARVRTSWSCGSGLYTVYHLHAADEATSRASSCA